MNESREVDVVALLGRLRSETAIRAASDAARNPSPAEKTLPDVEIRRHTTAIMDALTAAVAGDETAMAEANELVDDLAIDRLEQGVSLQSMLQGFRMARTVMIDQFVESGQEMFGAEALLPLLSPMDDLVGAVQERMIVAYRKGERDLLQGRRSARIEALRELLGGGSTGWAAEAGIEPGKQYYCLVADISIPREARRLDQAWMSAQGVSGIVHGYLCRVTPVLAAETGQDLVVVSPKVSVDELAGAYALCRQALEVYRSAGAVGHQPLTAVAQNIAVGGQPLLGRMLAREVLGGLDPTEALHRELAVTARAYFASGNQVGEVAGRMHLHANTVRYRLKRFTQLTNGARDPGEVDRSLAGSIRTWWALDSWLRSAEHVDVKLQPANERAADEEGSAARA